MLKLKNEIFVDEVEGAMILLDTIGERVVLLNEEEKVLFQNLMEKRFEEVVDEMCELYEGEREIIKKDVEGFYGKVLKSGFVEIVAE